MSLIKAVRGSSSTTDVYFYDGNGNPIVGSGAATYSIRDASNNLVLSGTGTQDVSNPAHWSAVFTLPLTCYVTNDQQKYAATWTLPVSTGNNPIITEKFEVVPQGDPVRPVNNTDVLVISGQYFQDQLVLPVSDTITNLNVQLLDISGTVLYDAGGISTTPTEVVNGQNIWQYTSTAVVQNMNGSYGAAYGVAPYMSLWTYQIGSGTLSYEYHPVYVITTATAAYSTMLRKLIDRAKIGEIHPYLQWTDTDLVHYLLRGLSVINSSNPQLTYFTLAGVPAQFVDMLIKASAIEALQAQQLAEGLLAFDFQGLGVSLNVNRAEAYAATVQMLQGQLDANLTRQKKLWAMTGGGTGNSGGILNISISPLTNRVTTVPASLFSSFLSFGGGFYGGSPGLWF